MLKKRRLGKNGPEVSAMGLGCMGMSGDRYGLADEAECRATLLMALENGMTMLDTADMYGWGHNETFIGKTLKEWNGEVFLATKFGFVKQPDSDKTTINGRPDYIKKAAEASLKRLDREVIDLYYLHRIDPNVPVEDSIGAMSELVKEGKVRYLGISEASAKTVQRAYAVHPIAALQTEYSVWVREVEEEILPMTRKLGIGFVAYSPLGRGMLTGKVTEDMLRQEGDRRNVVVPRFSEENFAHNQKLVSKFIALAKSRGVTPPQLALAWVLAKGEDIIPIPGTKKRKYLIEDMQAADITLTEKEIEEIESSIPLEGIRGERYNEEIMKGIDK